MKKAARSLQRLLPICRALDPRLHVLANKSSKMNYYCEGRSSPSEEIKKELQYLRNGPLQVENQEVSATPPSFPCQQKS
jgi:hypothetical protein